MDRNTIRQGKPGLKLDESLGAVPGVFLQNRNNYAQGERLSICGFGALAPFSVRTISVLVAGDTIRKGLVLALDWRLSAAWQVHSAVAISSLPLAGPFWPVSNWRSDR